ncbi:hypothetical protein [Leptolyngbya sp. CCY15150]|uniref:hypothetical protein n=1 Tax=Leptolyngbya sp. CCY15150 TaxID=2767772 RepID=UPI0019519EDB|nr:hypothetical protein [Leptolyngbya sp. CCY15150]
MGGAVRERAESGIRRVPAGAAARRVELGSEGRGRRSGTTVPDPAAGAERCPDGGATRRRRDERD